MSAFIVEDKTINRIVNILAHEIRRGDFSHALQEGLSKLGYDLSDNKSAEKLAKDMFDLNVSAVSQRYGKKEQALKFTYVPGTFTSMIQAFKSLNCWVYQCTEGDVPESSLYKFFTDIVETYLSKKIIYSLPEYDKAEWA